LSARSKNEAKEAKKARLSKNKIIAAKQPKTKKNTLLLNFVVLVKA